MCHGVGGGGGGGGGGGEEGGRGEEPDEAVLPEFSSEVDSREDTNRLLLPGCEAVCSLHFLCSATSVSLTLGVLLRFSHGAERAEGETSQGRLSRAQCE